MPTKAKLVTRTSTTSSVSSDNLGKGTELTFAEMDGNLINLRDATIGFASDDSTTNNLTMGDTLKIAGGTGITTAISGDVLTITNSNDTGDLTINGSTISAPSNADLVLEPGGTGEIHLKTDSASNVIIGESTSTNNFSFLPGSGIFRWNTGGATDFQLSHNNGGSILISEVGGTGSITIQPPTTEPTLFGSGSHNGTISSNGAHDLVLNTNSGTSAGSITLTDGANGDITIAPNGTGSVVIGTLNLNANEISSTNSNDNLVLNTSGTGIVEVNANITSTGTISTDGISIVDNTIQTINSNADLEINTSGTGKTVNSSIYLGVGDQTGGNIILTDQADGDFQTAAFANPGMLNPSGIQVDSAGSFHYSQVILNNFSTNANNALWTTRSRTNTHGDNAYLQSGDVIFQFFAAGWNGDTDGTGYFSANANVDLFASENHDASNRGGGMNFQTINTGSSSGGTTKLEITDDVTIKNPKAATTAALSVEGSIRLKNTSNPTNVTDSAHIFAKDDGSTSEVYVRDEAGNETKISPHNQSGEWEYYSKNVNTGKVFRVNMESLIKEVERLSGKTFIEQE